MTTEGTSEARLDNDDNPLVIGRVYRVTWDDCCTSGSFTSHLVGMKEDYLEFSNGVGGTGLDLELEE